MLRCETLLPFAESGLKQQTVSVAWSSTSNQRAGSQGRDSSSAGTGGAQQYSFAVQSNGGAVLLSDLVTTAADDVALHWQIENSSHGVLHLCEAQLAKGTSLRVSLEFGSQLFPGLAVAALQGKLLIAGLLSSGYAFAIELPLSGSSNGPQGIATAFGSCATGVRGTEHSSLRAALLGLGPRSVRPLDLSAQLTHLGQPTALAANAEALCIGTSSGLIICVPLASLLDSSPQTAYASSSGTSNVFELRDSSWGLSKLVAEVLYKPRNPSIVSLIPITLHSRQVLLSVHDDGIVRGWSPARKQHLFTLEGHEPSAKTSIVTYAAACVPSGSTDQLVLVTQIEAKETLARRAVAYTFSTSSASAKPSFQSRIELQLDQLQAVHTNEHGSSGQSLISGGGAGPSPVFTSALLPTSGTVVDAKASSDMVWCLVRGIGGALTGRSCIGGFSRSSGACSTSCMLQDGPELGAMAGSLGPVEQELWDAALESIAPMQHASSAPSSSQGAMTHAAARQLLRSQVLVPGLLCRGALRDALLASGAQLTASELKEASQDSLEGHVTNAVLVLQRRGGGGTNGSTVASLSGNAMSTSEAWRAWLAGYASAWSRRHGLLGLLASTRGGWLGAIRGGGMASVLRPASRWEMLAADGPSTPLLRDNPLNSDASVVYSCAREVASLLGPYALDSFLHLLGEGHDAHDVLLPRLVALLLSGPGVSAHVAGTNGAGATSAALTDASRAAAARWRTRRTALLVAVRSRLGRLSDPMDAIKQYVRALIMLSDQAAADLVLAAGSTSSLSDSLLAAAAPISSDQRSAAACLSNAARQVCRAGCAAGRDLLLLLGLMHEQALLLGAHHGPMLAGLKTELAPIVAELVQRAGLGLWLTTQPASMAADTWDSPVPPGLTAMAGLRINSTSPAADRNGNKRSAAAATVRFAASAANTVPSDRAAVSLAAILLPAMLPDYGKTCGTLGSTTAGGGLAAAVLQAPHEAALMAVLALQHGPQPRCSVSTRTLQLGMQLLAAGERGALADLALLPGALGCREPGPQLLRGVGLACRLGLTGQAPERASTWTTTNINTASVLNISGGGGGGGGGTARRGAAEEAVGCLFRAAAGLANPRGLASGDVEALRDVIASLRTQVLGMSPSQHVTSTTTAQQQQHAERMHQEQLDFYETAMALLDREHCPQGAAAFASAALSHLQRVPPSPRSSQAAAGGGAAGAGAGLDLGDTGSSGSSGKGSSRSKELAGRLWSNLFSYACAMGDPEAAYAAMLSNPLPERLLECLRRLLHELCEDNQLGVLCTLPLAGVIVRPPAGAIVPLLSEATAALARRAQALDLSAKPQPYRVLYTFLVAHNDFRGAARAMAAYAWRLRNEAVPTAAAAAGSGRGGAIMSAAAAAAAAADGLAGMDAVIAEALSAYDAAINALQVVDEGDAWLDLTEPWLAAHATAYHRMTATEDIIQGQGWGWGRSSSAGTGNRAVPLQAITLSGRLNAQSVGAKARGGDGDLMDASGIGMLMVTLEDLKRERQVLRCAAAVGGDAPGMDPRAQWPTQGDVDPLLKLLLQRARYEAAISLACSTLTGQVKGRMLEVAVGRFAGHCAREQLREEGAMAGPPKPQPDCLTSTTVDRSVLAGVGTFGSTHSAPLWARLQQLLSVHEQPGRPLRTAAADAILAADPRVTLPQWLIDIFVPSSASALSTVSSDGNGQQQQQQQQKSGVAESAAQAAGAAGCGPAALLALYLRHERLRDAVALVLQTTTRWSHADVRSRRRHHAAWFPYTLVEQLRGRLVLAVEMEASAESAGRAAGAAGELLGTLDACMEVHASLVASESARVEGVGLNAAGGGGGGGSAFDGFGGGVQGSPAFAAPRQLAF